MERRTLLVIGLAIGSAQLGGCANPMSKGMSSLNAPSAVQQPSLGTKVGSFFKSGAAKATAMVTPKPSSKQVVDGIDTPVRKKPGADLYISVAQIHERSGNYAEAEKQYLQALEVDPENFAALIAYGHLNDRLGKLEEATRLYQKALQKHPKEAAVYNDLGLCYHRRGMLKQSASHLSRAVELQPERHLYRNNLASVLVDQGEVDAALSQLKSIHREAVAHYNLGYLLNRKGNQTLALVHFQQAAAKDRTLAAAQQWVVQLTPPPAEAGSQLAGPAMPAAPQQRALVQPAIVQRAAVPPVPQVAAQPTIVEEADAEAPAYRQARLPEDRALMSEAEQRAVRAFPVRYPAPRPASEESRGSAIPPTPDQFRHYRGEAELQSYEDASSAEDDAAPPVERLQIQ